MENHASPIHFNIFSQFFDVTIFCDVFIRGTGEHVKRCPTQDNCGPKTKIELMSMKL